MPKLSKRLTDSLARSLPAPDAPERAKAGERPTPRYEIYWCKDTPGFGVRVMATGSRAWLFERRVDGATKRRTLGKVTGRGAISGEEARKLAVAMSADLQRGDDPLKVKKDQARLARKDITFAEAAKQYIEGKRRGKDGLPMKEHTKDGYYALLAESRPSRRHGEIGRPTQPGPLHRIANRKLSKIAGVEIRELYADLVRQKRRAVKPMQLLRAVLNWHGVDVPENPFSRTAPGRDRIILPPSKPKHNSVPPEALSAFWHAACCAGTGTVGGSVTGGLCVRFVLLTGARGGEAAGNEWLEGIRVRDFDRAGARIMLHDTKNRKDQTIYLSRQALAIAEQLARGKKPADRLFPLRSLRKTMLAICKAAGIESRGLHAVRKTFASVADELVSGYTLKSMLNHVLTNDVTGQHYVSKSESQLRKGWQDVADFIEEQASLVAAA